MLNYLDNAQNRAGKINENFSREVMELFTLGRGQYSERDIQEGARALTGWAIRPDRTLGTATATFLPRHHDEGIKTYLGRKGNLKTENVVDILANHPSTARTIARKLWSSFVYPNPEPAIVDRLAGVYKQSDRSIKSVVAALFASPEFYTARAYRSQLKKPMYFLLGSMRQLGIKADNLKVLGSLRAMGQNVLIMVQSEFGRRPAENGTGGTDHGTVAPVMLVGNVRSGFYGGDPALDSLISSNLPVKVDFRSVYAEILSKWYRSNPVAILGEQFPSLGFLA